jgi:hypothetical protein
MMQFHKDNITEAWKDLTEEFPEIFLNPSPEVLNLCNEFKDKPSSMPKNLEDLCNLRFGFECPIEWKGIIRDFCLKVDAIRKNAQANGDEAYYCAFILKSKFGTCRDQGTFFGKDKEKYSSLYYEASQALFDESMKIKPETPCK